jgi:hypothetical protein
LKIFTSTDGNDPATENGSNRWEWFKWAGMGKKSLRSCFRSKKTNQIRGHAGLHLVGFLSSGAVSEWFQSCLRAVEQQQGREEMGAAEGSGARAQKGMETTLKLLQAEKAAQKQCHQNCFREGAASGQELLQTSGLGGEQARNKSGSRWGKSGLGAGWQRSRCREEGRNHSECAPGQKHEGTVAQKKKLPSVQKWLRNRSREGRNHSETAPGQKCEGTVAQKQAATRAETTQKLLQGNGATPPRTFQSAATFSLHLQPKLPWCCQKVSHLAKFQCKHWQALFKRGLSAIQRHII